MNMKIYADNAATTKISDKAVDAMIESMNNNYANPSSLHIFCLQNLNIMLFYIL